MTSAALRSSTGVAADIVALLPTLKMFARKMTNSTADADDLMQDTALRALERIHQFDGCSLQAWLYILMRNLRFDQRRKGSREVGDPDGEHAAALEQIPDQEARIVFKEVAGAFALLPLIHREALMLIGVSGESYADAAEDQGCAIGTMKSRLNRARARLMDETAMAM